jgi:hypothetical protein
VFGEALSTARGILSALEQAEVLAEIARRLPAEEALGVARGIQVAPQRTRALAEVAPRLVKEQILDCAMHPWIETVRALTMSERGKCVMNFVAILPLIDALGGNISICGLGRSITTVGRWWP